MSQVKNKAMTGIFKPAVYAYMIFYIYFKVTFELITLKIGPCHYFKYFYRLLTLIKVLYPNKVMRINGKYKFQLYFPAFPGKAFFHALQKFDPRVETPGPITVVFSMTKACPYKCPHCYQKNDTGPDMSIELLKKVANEMQDIGVAMFDIEGGEPLVQFERLMELLTVFDDRAEVWVNTTGVNLTNEKARRMKEAGVYGVMISLHTADSEKFESFTGVKGSFETAKNALKIFQRHGIVTALNFCPSADDISSDGVEKLINLSAELDCSLVQVIHAKPSGGWLYKKDPIYDSKELMKKINNFHKKFNESKTAKNYPSVLFQVFEEDEKSFGCTAGGIDRFYINHEGEIQPCEFLNVSFGNVNDESFASIFKRMRSYFPKPGTNWLCCTEAHSIGKALKDNNLKKTPLPWEYTRKIVPKWNKGTDTPLYDKIGIYK